MLQQRRRPPDSARVFSAISRHCYYPHAYCPPFCGLFYYQVPQESSSTRFVVKSSLTGLTLFKHTASRSSIGGGNYG
nr:MAG TPA: hypothetical protein [Bacteriophage sp.]